MSENQNNLGALFKSRYLALVSSHADLVSRYNPGDLKLTFVSPSYWAFFGRSESELLGTSILDLLTTEDQRQASKQRLSTITPEHPTIHAQNMVQIANGDARSVDWVTTGIFNSDGILVEFQSVGRDVTDLVRAQEDLARSRMHYMLAARIAGVGFWVWDEIGDRLAYCTEEASAIYGVTVEESLNRSQSLAANTSTTHPDDLLEYENVISEAAENCTGYDITIRTFRKDGELRYIRHIAEPILDENGRLVQTVGTVQDVTDQKHSEEKIAHMARHDPLTGLPNRALIHDRLGIGLKAAKRESRQLAILFLDLDGLKMINDTDGHQAGDHLLINVAERLSNCVREMDTVGRLGGDEFIVVLGGDVSHEHVVLVAEKILTSVSQPYDLRRGQRHISASIGISLYPSDGETPESLIAAADNAMYAVKRSGKNDYQFSSACQPD